MAVGAGWQVGMVVTGQAVLMLSLRSVGALVMLVPFVVMIADLTVMMVVGAVVVGVGMEIIVCVMMPVVVVTMVAGGLAAPDRSRTSDCEASPDHHD